MFSIVISNKADIARLEKLFLDTLGRVIPVAAAALKEFKQEDISAFCHLYAIYQVPTIELIDWLRCELEDFLYPKAWGHKVIEIGAGNGCIARNIPIAATDNFLQRQEHIKSYYKRLGQPVIQYGEDVVNLEASKAVATFKPAVVIGCWVTQYGATDMVVDSSRLGIKELDFAGKVKRYIMIGNEDIHRRKLVLKEFSYKALKFDWLYSRHLVREKNVIYDINLSK